uniref:RNA-guided endonuclease InsQ/TnpB family protein n=1 Tax=Crocosphaera sp. Alani8 TaxID=3038952 RepID=UPI00313DFEA9
MNITYNGEKTSKYANPRHLKKHEKNLARKQAKLARKKKGAECTAACDLPLNGRSVGGSKSREKARKLVARVHERISNARQDFLHKLSRKIVDDNQVVVVENLNVKGMVRNHNLAKAISDTKSAI